MEQLIRVRFAKCPASYDRFEKALLATDVKLITKAMNSLAKEMFSPFDTGKGTSDNEPEHFYHGFVPGMLVKMKDRYVVTSNPESGYGRYDIMLIPLNVYGCEPKNDFFRKIDMKVTRIKIVKNGGENI